MKSVLRLFICAMLVSSATFGEERAAGGKEDFLKELTEGLERAAGGLTDAAVPIIETEGRKIWAEIQSEVDQGFLELTSLTNDVDQVVDGLEKKLREVVTPEDMKNIEGALDLLGGKALDQVVEELAGEAMKLLDVPAEKFDRVEAILSKDIKARGDLLADCLDEGQAGISLFKSKNEKMVDDTLAELKALVPEEDIKKLEAWFDQTGESIEELFGKKKPVKEGK